MQIRLVIVFLSVIFLSAKVFAEDEIKRSTFPFMAFIYYQDETILDLSGERFLQGAVLIRPTFLISSSPESSISNDPLSKTLLARLGATVIDSKFSLNEDEEEQEQEVIQITRPYHHNSTQWWLTDICLLKTLQPILTTKSVRYTQLSTKTEPEDKLCQIIVFKKKTGTDVRVLTRMYVEMLPGTQENCGEKFVRQTMACSTDQDSSDEKQLTADFCHGNSGGPLICDNDVMGLQTYINGDCKPPHLHQLLAPRKQFLDCGIDEKCDDKQDCKHVCTVIHKDAPPTIMARASTEPTTIELTTMMEITQTSTETTKTIETTQTTENTETTEAITTEINNTTMLSTTASTPTSNETTAMTTTKSWPNEPEGRRSGGNDSNDIAVRADPEVQRTPVTVQIATPLENSANRLSVFKSLICNIFLLRVLFM